MPSSGYIMSSILPQECFKNVIEFVKEEPNSNIYSCVLVNRQWMRECLPLLWSQPFNDIPTSSNGVKLINTYISCLSTNKKRYLSDNSIYLRQNSTPEIDYLAYLKELNYEIFEEYTRFWLLENNYSNQASSAADLNVIIESLDSADIEYNNNQLKILLSCLFSMFIEKSISLTHIIFCSDYKLCLDLPELPAWISSSNAIMGASYAAPNNSDSLKRLTTFVCEINDSDLRLPNLMIFMGFLSARCKMLSTIVFTWKSQYDINIYNYLIIEIIKEQRQLKEIILDINNFNIEGVIDTLINTQQHNLVVLHLENADLSNNSQVVISYFCIFHKLKVLKLINSCEHVKAIRTYEMITEYRHPVI
uniref:F-box domain-containing protein n=1 Tax=Anthurium amnicola TaxID=1678845 RepID=A0A1D1Y1R3_9ARAE